MPSRQRAATGLVIACGLAAIAGCGSRGPERSVVAGIVTYQGEKITNGQIRFLPCPGTEGPTMTGAIDDGQYKVETWGGVPVGSYQVQIAAYRVAAGVEQGKGAVDDRPGGDRRPQQYLPPRYSSAASELKTTIEPGHATLVRDFALTD